MARRSRVRIASRLHVGNRTEFQALEKTVRAFEDEEIAMGELSHRGAAERRTRAQLTGMERRLEDMPLHVAQSVASELQPTFEKQRLTLDDERALGLDRDYLASLHPDVQRSYMDVESGRSPIGSGALIPFNGYLRPTGEVLRIRRLRFEQRRDLALQNAREGNGPLEAFIVKRRRPNTCDQCIAEGCPSGTCQHVNGRTAIQHPPTAGLVPRVGALQQDAPRALIVSSPPSSAMSSSQASQHAVPPLVTAIVPQSAPWDHRDLR